MNKRIAIIGAGAAGMMAAISVKETSPLVDVTLFEKNASLGAKVIISGGGRCNVTTGVTDVRRVLENYPRGSKFLMSAMYRFPPDSVMNWFEEHGVHLKTETDLRVFPVSDDGKEIVAALKRSLVNAGVTVKTNTQVLRVTRGKNECDHRFLIEYSENGIHENAPFDSVILTTGGSAYRHTGSTGDGYAFARELGHTITLLAPSLHSFLSPEAWIAGVAGVSFPKASFRLTSPDNQRTFDRSGPFLFTHKGISGPAIFALSALSAYEQFSPEHPMRLEISFFPDDSPETISTRLDDLINRNTKKHLPALMDAFLPHSICAPFIEKTGINPHKQAAQLSRDERKHIVMFLRAFPLTLTGRGAGDEFVTAGGVSLKGVNTNTMESKLCPGLFFAGEILDIDGFTGGYNLQASWATGRLAGESTRSSE